MHFTYCPHCGERLVKKEIGVEGLVPWCESCRQPLFDIPDTCVIVLAVNEYGEAVLLRQGYVSKDHYVCVAGHIKPGETAEKSAAREVEEETGLSVEDISYIGSYAYEKRGLLMLGKKSGTVSFLRGGCGRVVSAFGGGGKDTPGQYCNAACRGLHRPPAVRG